VEPLIPTSWSIFPAAWHTLLTYLSLHIPPKSVFTPYDPLQQLSYAAVVFVLTPFMLLTGAAMSPAIEAMFPWYIKLFGGRQVARSLHFLSLIAFVLFTVGHTALVLIVYFPDNIRNIVFGTEQGNVWAATAIGVAAVLVVVVIWAWASWQTLRHPRGMQHALGALVDPLRLALLHRLTSKQMYQPSTISPYFWVNGRPPDTSDHQDLAQSGFATWKLSVGGLVEHCAEFSLEDLRALPKHTQITKHNCIQGWSGVAEWGGVCLQEVLKVCVPLPQAK
jgi:methionine sulfoxide reductase catalytic subunit